MRSRFLGFATLGVALGTLSGSASAWDEIVAARGWTQVDYTEDAGCRAEVRGNGQFYRIAGAGFVSGEEVRFYLQNEDIKPVEYVIVADADGAWRKFYVPFLWHRSGGRVTVALDGASCSLDLSFDWTRRTA